MRTSSAAAPPLFEREDFRAVAGPALRPGGEALTARLLDLAREQAPGLLGPGASVADIGCGRGASLRLLAARGFRPIGLEPSAELLNEARSLAPEALLLRGRAEAVPLRGGTCQAALCECALSVTSDPDAALAEMRRILAPGGLLLLSDLYLRQSGGGCGNPAPGCASGAVTRLELESRLERAGFALIVFEDHSRLLAELAARLLFAGFERAELGLGCQGGARPGYFLCIARKEAP
ncbi:DVU_1556 family methyltransferase [Fundidesulfovibrio agrisoli]|uniref:DVU_1556 family methyltransferase n=1 Tax=Fundidesulfovibrio agrisoli TaxID=2922717 RepID=UPI001FAE6636|nr:class I SAM-dependent methyltransferase [Fundidesulfovibrio agrisoli]